MRTLGEIITLAKDGGRPEYDELLYGFLALDALAHFDREFIIEMPDNPAYQGHFQLWAEESFRRFKTALETPPKTWVGWNNDPANPEYQHMRQLAIRMVEKIIGEGG